MPNKITYTITTSDGKQHQVSEENIKKYGMDSYASAYNGATIRMRDANKEDYDIPLGNFQDAVGEGLHPFRVEHKPQQKAAQRRNTVQSVQPTTAPTASKWEPTPVQKMGFQMQMDEMNRKNKQMLEDFNERMNNMRSVNPITQESKPRLEFNKNTGKLENVYGTASGNSYTNKAIADLENQQYRLAAENSVSAQLRKANQERAGIVKRLDEIAKQEDKKNDGLLAQLASASNVTGGSFYYSEELPNKRYQNEEYKRLHAALGQLDERIATLNDENDRNNGVDVGFWRGFGRTVSNSRNWDFGLQDAMDASAMLTHKNSKTEGEKKASETMLKQTLANQEAQQQYAGNADFWNRAGMMTGYMPSFMVDFIATGGGFEGANLFSKGATKMATKAVGKKAAEQIAKEGVKKFVKSNGAKGMAKAAENWTIKALGTTADELLVRAPLMTNTIQANKTASDITKRKLGDVVKKEDGTLDYEDKESAGRAIWQGEANSIIENYSEMFGTHLEPVLSAKALSKVANTFGAKRISSILAKADAGALGGMMGKTNELFKKMGVSDYVGEVGEEYYGQLWRTMLNLDDAYMQNPDGTRTNLFATPQFHGDIWGGMALSMGMMGAGKTAITASQYASAKHGVNRADKAASNVLGDEWEPLRMVLDMTTNENVGEVADAIVNGNDYNDKEKSAILDYMEQSLILRGINLADVAEKRSETDADKGKEEANDSWNAGYNAETDEEKQQAYNTLDEKRSALSELVEDIDAIDNPIEYAKQLREAGADDKLIAAVDEYANALSAVQGIQQRETEDAEDAEQQEPTSYERGYNAGTAQDRRDIVLDMYENPSEETQNAYNGLVDRIVEEADAEETRLRNEQQQMMANDGTMRLATLKLDDKPVYIIDGNVQMLDDGSMIDVANSDNSIVVFNPETGKREMISPDALLSVEDPVPSYELDAQISAQRDAVYTQKWNEANGVLPFNPGDAANVQTEDGNVIPVQIVSNDGGGNCVVATQDGSQMEISIFELQRVADDIALADYKQRRGITDEQEAEQPVKATEQPMQATEQTETEVAGHPTEYAEDTELVITDEDGTDKRAIVVGSVRYENGEFVPDANGEIVEYYVEGEDGLQHAHKSDLDEKVKSYSVPQVDEGRETADNVQKTTENVQNPTDNVPETHESVQNETESVLPANADEVVSDADEVVSVPEAGDNVVENIPEAEEGAPESEPMPMTADEEPNYFAASPERSHAFIYNEAGLSRQEANEHVMANYEQANKALVKAKSAAPPKMGTSLKKYNEQKAQRQQKIDEAQAAVDYWNKVREIQQAINSEEQAKRAEAQATAHDKAVEEVQAEREAQKQAEAERKEVGNENPMPAITEKWNNATKVDGAEDDIVLPNGKQISGHYVLHESGVPSPSHNATQGFTQTEGFPMDMNDNTVNDRDYEHDKEAQNVTRNIAQKYDQRALQTPVVVSKDGVVLSGNGRTMAGELAAAENTDGAYIDYLTKHAQKYGFTPEQVQSMQHPRISFVPNEDLPYSADTFSMFNQQEMKSLNKTEHSVKLGKTVPDDVFSKVVRTINAFDTLGDFYSDDDASFNAISLLNEAGIIPQAQLSEMVDGHKLSAVGREVLENMLIGKCFESNPDVIRMLTKVPTMRQSVIFALAEISNNLGLGEKYSLKDELAEAIKLCFEARMEGGFGFGDAVSSYARQLKLFAFEDEMQTVADINNATILMLADVLNDKRISQLKKVLVSYNDAAAESAAGQINLFTGDVRTKEDIIKDVITLLNYGTKQEIDAAGQSAVERRKAEATSVQQNGTVEPGNQEGANGTREHSLSSQDTEPRQTITLHDPRSMSDEEKERRGEMLRDAYAIDVKEGQIVATADMSARKVAEKWWNERFSEPVLYNTEVGEVEINRNSIEDSLAHRYGQAKLDAITSLVDGFENAVYLGSLPDSIRQEGVNNHYFAFPINYKGERSYVFCRAMQDSNKNRLYVHEVFVADKIKKGNTLQTAAFQPHGGIALYRDILANVLDRSTSSDSKDTKETVNKQGSNEENTSSLQKQVEEASAETNINPTPAQAEAGNYKKGHVVIGDFDICIENPAGSERKGVDADGNEWSVKMNNAYGYIRGTEGVDGDHIDVFLAGNMDDWNGREVFVVDQTNKDGSFDEHKCMIGFNSLEDAEAAYYSNYDADWKNMHPGIRITGVSNDDFNKWIASSHRKTKPFAEYSNVKATDSKKEIAPRQEGYSIDARKDTRDNSDIFAVKFEERVSKDEFKGQKEIAKKFGGYWSNFGKKGFLFKTEEAAHDFAETVMGRTVEEVEDEAPITINEIAEANGGEAPTKVEETKADANEEAKEEKQSKSKWVNDEDAERFEELRKRLREKLGQMNSGIDPEVFMIGTEMGFLMLKKGARKLNEFAKSLVELAGDGIRPYITSIYDGARRLSSEEIQREMSPHDEVDRFDAYNFDKEGAKDIIATAETKAREVEAREVAQKTENELKAKRNEEKRNKEKQIAADTETISDKATSVASEVESKLEAANTEESVNGLAKQVDEQLESVNEQLALLGYYKADEVEKDFNESFGYMRNAEKKALKDAKQLAENLVRDLGLDAYEATHGEADKNGKRKTKPLAVANIAPAGGDISIRLPLEGERELYINIYLDPEDFGGGHRSDDLHVTGIMYRVENPNGKERYGSNQYLNTEVTYADMLHTIKRWCKEYLPKEDYVAMAERIAKENKIATRPKEFRHLKIGDKVIYKGNECTIHDFDAADGQLVLDTGLAPVLYEVANWSDVSLPKAKDAEVTKPTAEQAPSSNKPKKTSKKKEIEPKTQIGDLFGDLFEQEDLSSNNEEEQQPAHAEKFGDAKIHRTFAMTVKNDMLSSLDNGTKPYRSILELRKRARELGMDVDNDGRTDILLQELVEDGLVRAAREVTERNGRDSKETYDLICKLYEMQPTIAARSSNRIKMQQYSTPLPMAWNAGRFAMNGKEGGNVLEPTAGNGMLVFMVPANQVHANELDDTRLSNLREQGFSKVTQQDATEPFVGGKRYDAIIANPPFGKRDAIEYDGKMIGGLDPQITLNALASMKDDGKAAIIIGGNMEYAKNGGLKSMKPFFTYLYDHYNVKGVVDMDGKLYAKQGTTYPTRMILIDGRRSDEERAQCAVYPPVESKAVRKAESFEDLYDIVNEIVKSKEKTNGTEILRSQQGQLVSVNNKSSRGTDGKGHSEQHRKNDVARSGERGTENSAKNNLEGSRQVLPRERGEIVGNGEAQSEIEGDRQRNGGGIPEPNIQRVDGVGVPTKRDGLTTAIHAETKKRTLTDEKSAYRPHNTAFSLNSVAPAAMVEAMDNVLSQIEAKHGSIDEFVTKELGYDTIDDAHNALAAEQMDSVAMAIYQMKQGQALIIGDQTGVGKGRQMAALIRWAVKRGEKPVFITQKADLFSDIYRDLVDVGSGDLIPFIFNSDGAMVDSNGNTVHKPLSKNEMARVFATGKLPDIYDFAVLTYSQVNTGDGISQRELQEAAKKNGTRARKSKSEGKATPKATFLRVIAEDNYLFLDESHTAAGSSNTGAYLQSILRNARAATFASATFAKRPDTMPLYAIRTAMSQAKVEPDKLISIIEKGGVTLQEIMSRELTNAGQMVRRERDMSDVKTDWKTIDDAETVKRARDNYDRTITAFNAIIKFQEDYVKPLIDNLDQELAFMAESAGVKRGTDKMGVDNVPFASKTYNYTKQLMLALKVDAIANEVEAEINAGRHPVIALESTMESSIKEYNAGDVIEEPTFSASLLRGLDSVMQYTIKDENGNERSSHYAPKQLGEAGEKAYYDLQRLIRESTSDIYISPLDAIIDRLHEKGYKVGELTGRNMYVARDENGNAVVRRRADKDKKRMQREFNNGELDVLILNKSASTGISLHASEKFSDQRQRSMIIAQPLSDINDYMQMIGRIDRTGQVHRGYYINLGLPVPAENRFLMMLSTKLKSLNANTTTSQDSESNEVDAPDLLNKYGSQVVVEYLRDNPDVYEKMGAPLKKADKGSGNVGANELDDYKPQDGDARKITGYVALLSTKEQEDFYDDVVRRYNELIKYLNDTGNNDLKITVMPLRAKTIDKRVSSEGIDANGSNPFAKNSYVEKVEMDVLRKPMKADEVRKTIEQICKGQQPDEYLGSILTTIKNEDEARLAAEDARFEKAQQRAQEDIAKHVEKINAQQKRTAEEKQNAILAYTSETKERVEAKHSENVKRIKLNHRFIVSKLNMFEVGKSYLVPDNLESLMFDFASPAIFCGYKTKDSKITASTTLAVFATLDGRRRVEVKLSQYDALGSIQKMTNDNWDSARSTTLDNWDSQIPTESRKEGYIMTGNILQAISDTQDERSGYPGQLISYTDIDGNVHDGILMPDKWNATMLKTSGAPIISRLQQIKNYQPIVSNDGKVEITGSEWSKTYYLTVPKTKKDGAVYYENQVLLEAAGGNFYPYRGNLRADIPEAQIEGVVKELSKLGVKVKESGDGDSNSYRVVNEPELLNELENGEWEEVYRVMQVIDGKLYPPMAAVREGDLVDPIRLGMIEQADEHPELITFDKNGKPQFLLNKGQGKGSLSAAYNPYWHTSRTPLNDQFSSAYIRPNLVVVKTLVPKSELTSGYRAEYAKDAVGEMRWHSGPVSSQLAALGEPRRVILSRYDKPMEIVPHSKVAKMIAEQLKGKDIAIPHNTVWPQLRDELEKLGVEISDEASGTVGENPEFGKAEYVTDKMIAEMNKKAKESMQNSPEAKRAEAERLSSALNTPVEVVEDVNTITDADPVKQAKMRRAKGWYDTKTGKVVIVLPNNLNVEDVAATSFHEIVAHKGLRELVGEENYNDFLREVYEHANADVRRRIGKLAEKNGWDFDKATDEYLGGLSEKGFEDFDNAERSIWQVLKEKVLNAINKFLKSLKLPKWVKLGDNELRYMLWRSHENLRSKNMDPIQQAQDIVKREELKLGTERNFNNGDLLFRDMNWKADEVLDMAKRNNIRGASISHFVDTSEDIEMVRKYMGEEVYNMIMDYFNDNMTSAIYLPSRDLVVVFTNKAFDAEDAECSWFHEQTHAVWHNAFSAEERERYGTAVLAYLKDNDLDLYNHIIDKYGDDKYKSEACSYLIEKVVREYGSDRFMSADFSGSEEIVKFAEAVQNYLRNGKRKEGGNQPRRIEADEKTVQDVRNGSNEGRASQESEIFRQVSRSKNETGDIWSDMSMGFEERMTAAATRLSNNHAGDKRLKNDAMRAIGGNIANLRKAMSLQRQFDMSTIKRVSDLARILMDNGYLSGLSQQEVKRLLAATKNSVGHEDVAGSVQKVLDIMIDNQLHNASAALTKLVTIKGSKLNDKGVEVQGYLDPDGQLTMKVFKKAYSLAEDDINQRITEAANKMSSTDNTVADEAAIEYAGLTLALDYVQNIAGSVAEEKALRDDLKEHAESATEQEKTTDAYRQYVESVREAIRKNKTERVMAYYNLVGRLSDALRESIENASKFREAEKLRVGEIHHNANSDMEGRSSDEHHKTTFKEKFLNNSFVSFAFAPLATFDQMLRMFGNKSANGEGYLYNRFMRGWVDAREKEIVGVRSKFAILDNKVAEVFGKRGMKWGDLIRMESKLPKASVSFWNGGEMQERELTQGNLLYIYMVNKMLDGRMKLRKMGITEEDVENIENFLDPRIKELGDWMQKDFLVGTRNEYNETHKRMFGASMAAIEDYFPLKILSNARADKPEDLDNPNESEGISTTTGSIIKRRRNALALDITGADAFSVILDHIAQMEHWNAYAEWNRDLNTLRTYKRFRNQVQNMNSVYGGGEKLWKKFNDACRMAAGTYRPPRAKLDEAAVNFAKGVTAAKVSFRAFTALKQLLSMPAFIPETRAEHLAADLINPVGAWRWCMDNLPIFKERWESRMSGDPRLLKSDMDWKVWRSRVMEISSRLGMSPNAFVDALTVSIGAHSIYKTRRKQYLNDGYDVEEAEQRAKQDATILFNQTQQSSESAFTSTMQVDRSWLSVLFTVFRNSSMSYTRQLYDALRNTKRNLTSGQRAKSIEFMAKQMVRDGIEEPIAKEAAKRKFNRQLMKDVLKIGVFGYVMQLAWNLGAYLPYLLFGNDDDEKKRMWDDVWTHTMFGSIEGLTGGDVMSKAGAMAVSGEGNPSYLSKDMPLTSDIMNALKKIGQGQNGEAMSDIINLVVQAGVGVNPQSITDGVLSIIEACGDDPALAHEASICIMRILQVPQSQIDKMYFDEIGLSGDEVSNYTPAQLAERYAKMKIKRGGIYAPWTWDDGDANEKQINSANKKIKERFGRLGDKEVNEAYVTLEDSNSDMAKLYQSFNKAKMDKDAYEAKRLADKLQEDPDKFASFMMFRKLDARLDKLVGYYLNSDTPEDAELCKQTIIDYKRNMVEALQATDDAKRKEALNGLTNTMQNFGSRYKKANMSQLNR